MRAVAERPQLRLAAAAQRDRRALDLDLAPVLIDQPERPAHDQRAVAVRRDRGGLGRGGIVGHDGALPIRAACECGVDRAARRL
jgi:hypothetical protein